jgi:hypothetical protein
MNMGKLKSYASKHACISTKFKSYASKHAYISRLNVPYLFMYTYKQFTLNKLNAINSCYVTLHAFSVIHVPTYTSTVFFKGTPDALIVRDAAVHAL